ncbi:hypothetical protein EYF80_030515 [Liparis tanakae]|uniref:Uncharacterized protein n=1 Tax=Liparis tanakae TaxID=230148 RepID=A0A4Z2H1A4_9TELE|nr:hypothetical protein EYF80_030515 [Liparis tanakae]
MKGVATIPKAWSIPVDGSDPTPSRRGDLEWPWLISLKPEEHLIRHGPPVPSGRFVILILFRRSRRHKSNGKKALASSPPPSV